MQQSNPFNPELQPTDMMKDDPGELFEDPDSLNMVTELSNLMNETWDTLGSLLDSTELTVVAVKYALPADKLNAILVKYLKNYENTIDVIAHVYGVTNEKGDSELSAEIEYYYKGQEYAPDIRVGTGPADPDVDPKSFKVFNCMPSPVEVLQETINQDTRSPLIFINDPNVPSMDIRELAKIAAAASRQPSAGAPNAE